MHRAWLPVAAKAAAATLMLLRGSVDGWHCRAAGMPRLVHADLAGPFKRSVGGYQYFLVLIDDHSRWKSVFFLRRKSEAIKCVRQFVSRFNGLLNKGKKERTQVVGTLHTDNAGEFLSRDFADMLDSELIDQTRCPAHVHQLNGVAERAIRTIMENVRANMAASGAPLGF